jgi:hypothetical protein
VEARVLVAEYGSEKPREGQPDTMTNKGCNNYINKKKEKDFHEEFLLGAGPKPNRRIE